MVMRICLEGCGHMASNEMLKYGGDAKWAKFSSVSGAFAFVEAEQVHIGEIMLDGVIKSKMNRRSVLMASIEHLTTVVKYQ